MKQFRPVPSKPPRVGEAMRNLSRLVNPLTMRFAGTRVFPLFGVIHHPGRRSGRAYATPVAVRRSAAGFVVPMTFGERADWFKNVSVAAGCTLRWRGRDWALVAPEVIGWADARPAFNIVQRPLIRLFGLSLFLRLSDAGTDGRGAP